MVVGSGSLYASVMSEPGGAAGGWPLKGGSVMGVGMLPGMSLVEDAVASEESLLLNVLMILQSMAEHCNSHLRTSFT